MVDPCSAKGGEILWAEREVEVVILLGGLVNLLDLKVLVAGKVLVDHRSKLEKEASRLLASSSWVFFTCRFLPVGENTNGEQREPLPLLSHSQFYGGRREGKR